MSPVASRQSSIRSKRNPIPIATAIRESLRSGYSWQSFRADAQAGLVVGIVAVPLAMALAIACGVPPQYGLYTALVAAPLTAIFGGSRVNISGPTAAFVVLLAPITAQFGLGGLAIASMMAGVILLAMGLFRLGRLVTYIPHPVTTGFTAGIAVVIATLQLKDFFGLEVPGNPEAYWERIEALWIAAPSVKLPDLTIGALTLLLLILWPRITRKVPAPLVAISVATVAAYLLGSMIEGFHAVSIGDKFRFTLPDGSIGTGIPASLPTLDFPWNLPGVDGVTPVGLSYDMIKALLGAAFAVAVLGAIESLLCAVVADGMSGTRHDSDAELVGQGIGNMAAPFFGGFASTGAIARTATNIRAGGRTPIASLVHVGLVLAALVALGPLLSHLPMSALAALLLIVAWNMSDARHFIRILRTAPRSDVLVLLACFLLTVIFDMVVAVTVGVVLAAFLFMRRMAELSGATLIKHEETPDLPPLPPGVVHYEIAGPLFFGAAEKAMSTIARVAGGGTRAVIIGMSQVPTMDVTGLVALKSAIGRLNGARTLVVITGAKPKPMGTMSKAGIAPDPGRIAFAADVEEAIEVISRTEPRGVTKIIGTGESH